MQSPDQSRPSKAPDPAHTYERAKPERESPDGRLHRPPARPDEQADPIGHDKKVKPPTKTA